MRQTHDCMDWRRRVALEGNDVVIEVCTLCERVRMERGNPTRPMAWFRAPSPIDPSFPWRYAYDDPQPGNDDDPEVWVCLRTELGGLL